MLEIGRSEAKLQVGLIRRPISPHRRRAQQRSDRKSPHGANRSTRSRLQAHRGGAEDAEFFLEKQTPRTSALSASPRCALKRLLASQAVELLPDVVELVLQRGGAVEEVLGGL